MINENAQIITMQMEKLVHMEENRNIAIYLH